MVSNLGFINPYNSVGVPMSQKTYYFWFIENEHGGVVYNNFECEGKPNLKIIYNKTSKKIKSVNFDNSGKFIKGITSEVPQ